MAEPVPEPTAAQLEIVGEIMMIDDPDEVLSIVSAYPQAAANAKWALTLTDITNWDGELWDIKKAGDKEFFEGVSEKNRLDFRNKVLRRYGQTEMTTDQPAYLIESTLGWF